MARGYATYICGGDMRPGPRGTDCPDPLHDHPLPAGYVDASEEAASRLYRKWRNVKCKQCELYGWVPPAFGEGCHPGESATGTAEMPTT